MRRAAGELALRVAHKTGTDRATTWALVLRAWSVIAGPVSLFLIARYFTVELQGYYYTFASVIALQLFAELGLSQVLTQFTSHEWIGLRIDGTGRVEGSEQNVSRLASLVRFAAAWYGVGALGILVVLLVVGPTLFGAGGATTTTIAWRGAWVSLVVVTSLNFTFVPVWAILTGCGQIEKVNAFRAVLGIAVNLAGWVAILAGAGLFAIVVTGTVSFLGGLLFVLMRYRSLFASLLRSRGEWRVDWRHELMPMQARIGISALTSYFMYYLFTPVLFRYQGPAVAARMGMSLALGNALSSLSSAWVETRAPQFGMLVARREYAILDGTFRRALLTSAAVAACGGVAVWILFSVLLVNHPFGARVLSPLPLALILLVTVANQLIGAFNTYLRAHRQEPTMAVSVAVNVLCGISTWYLGVKYSALGAAAGYAAIVLLLQLPLVAMIWLTRRREWHSAGFTRGAS